MKATHLQNLVSETLEHIDQSNMFLFRARYDRLISSSADNLDLIGSTRSSGSRWNPRSAAAAAAAAWDPAPRWDPRVPLAQWTEAEVRDWLIHVGLQQYEWSFSEHHVTGEDLANISLTLLGA